MSTPRAAHWTLLCCLSAGFAWLASEHVAPLRIAGTWLDDIRVAYLAAPRPVNTDIIVLTINEDTLSRFPFRAPVDRGYLASLLRELGRRNVRAVGLDLIFDQATKAVDDTEQLGADDKALLDVMDAFPKPVVIATGDQINGLTPRQLEFQKSYLHGRRVGSGSLLLTDGIVRSFYPGELVDGELRPSFMAALAQSIGVDVPTTPQLLDFVVRTDSGASPIRTIPSQMLNLLPASWFANVIVLVGADLPNQDRYRTPLSVLGGEYATMAGVQIHAQALAQLIDGRRFPSVGAWTALGLLLASVGIGFALPFLNLHLALKGIVGFIALAGYWLFGFFVAKGSGALVPLVPPTIAFLISVSFSSAYGRYAARAEKRFVREALGHYVSETVIDQILLDPAKLRLGGEQREMSYVFTDLAGFTTLSESLEPGLVVGLLQEYFDGLLKIALKWHGTIDRLVGDGANVIFGAPMDQPDHAERAVRCALEIDAYCESFREQQRRNGIAFGITRIGVHTGTGIAGNVGSTERFQYTAHGDAINTAARLESANKQFGTRVCISAESALACKDLTFRPIGNIVVRGKSQGVDCVTPCHELSEAAVREYLIAYELIEVRDPAVEQVLTDLRRRYPMDPLIAYQLARIMRGEIGPTIVME